MADLLRTPPSSDTVAEIARFLRVLHGGGGTFEVRAPKCLDRPGSTFASTTSGYFQAEHIEDAAVQIAELDASGRAPNIYVTLNPVRPDLLARSANRLKPKAAETTADADIVVRRWMLVDCDAVRPAGVSATDAELALAKAKADEVLAFLTARGWPEPVRVMSGNGHHLLYRVDLPADDGGLIKAVLGTIAATFDGGGVTIDRSVHNAARITKVAGTMARKGDHLVGVAGVEDRPHRRSVLLSAPENAVVVPKETLEALVNALATPTTVPVAKPEMGVPRTAGHTQRPRRDTLVCTPDGVRAYLEQHGVEVKGESRNGTKTILKLACCPVTPSCVSTGDSDIAVLVNDDGSIGYKNQHNRGEGITWHDVRATIDPEYARPERGAGSALVAELELAALSKDKGGRLTISVKRSDGTEITRDTINPDSARARRGFIASLAARVELDAEQQEQLDAAIRGLEPPASEPASEAVDPTGLLAQADEHRESLLAETPAHILDAAGTLLRDPSLIDRIVRDLGTIGIVGEHELALTLYVQGVSRLLDKPISAIVQGTSSSGKSYTIERVASLYPDEVLLRATDMTPQSLYYLPPGRLVHCWVVAGERSRIENDERAEAKRALREMISAGYLRKIITIKQRDGSMLTVELHQPGPIAFVESTTQTHLFDEDANRCFLLSTDETGDQTGRVIAAAARHAEGASIDTRPIIAVHHAAQRLLRRVDVRIPYATRLSEGFPTHRPDARRAFGQLLSLIKAIATLHQYQRCDGPISDGQIIQADVTDYVIARRLLQSPLGRSMGGALTDAVSRFGHRLIEHYAGRVFTSSEISSTDGVLKAKSKVNDYLRALADAGVVECVEASRGNKPSSWRVIGEPPEPGAAWLPTLDQLGETNWASRPELLGAAGQQRSFLGKCWSCAAPPGSGQQRGNTVSTGAVTPKATVAAPAAPALPQASRGNKDAVNHEGSGVLPRDPGQPYLNETDDRAAMFPLSPNSNHTGGQG